MNIRNPLIKRINQLELWRGRRTSIPLEKRVVMVLPTVIKVKGLDEVAKSFDLSRSELCEQIGRGILIVTGSQ